MSQLILNAIRLWGGTRREILLRGSILLTAIGKLTLCLIDLGNHRHRLVSRTGFLQQIAGELTEHLYGGLIGKKDWAGAKIKEQLMDDRCHRLADGHNPVGRPLPR